MQQDDRPFCNEHVVPYIYGDIVAMFLCHHEDVWELMDYVLRGIKFFLPYLLNC